MKLKDLFYAVAALGLWSASIIVMVMLLLTPDGVVFAEWWGL